VTSFQYAQETIFLRLLSAMSFQRKIRRTDLKILKRGIATCSPARFLGIMSAVDQKALALSRKIRTARSVSNSDIVDVSESCLDPSQDYSASVSYWFASMRAQFRLQLPPRQHFDPDQKRTKSISNSDRNYEGTTSG